MRAGEEFELRVFDAVKEALGRGLLGLLPGRCEVFHQKGYPSAARGGRPIKVDVVIELHSQRTARPPLLWIWECKDHSGSISVGELERFYATLQQLGVGNTIGTVISSTGAFEEAAWNFAVSHNIGLSKLVMGEVDEIEEVFSYAHPLVLLLLLIPHTLAFLFRRDRNQGWDDYWKDVRYEAGFKDVKGALCEGTFPRKKNFYGIGPLMDRPRPGLCFTVEAYIEMELSKRGVLAHEI